MSIMPGKTVIVQEKQEKPKVHKIITISFDYIEGPNDTVTTNNFISKLIDAAVLYNSNKVISPSPRYNLYNISIKDIDDDFNQKNIIEENGI